MTGRASLGYVIHLLNFLLTYDGLYLCFPLGSDPSNVLPHHVANVDLLQDLGNLEDEQEC